MTETESGVVSTRWRWIVAIWLAVLLATLYGPDFESVEATGARVTIPSGLGVAFFALFATVAVAKYGFERKETNG